MSTISDSKYICNFSGCKKYLKEPISLPCGDMVCRKHVSDTSTSFKCPDCEEEFIVSEEGFKMNWKMNETLKTNSHLTGEHKQVKEMFDQIEKVIDSFYEKHLNRPQLFIHEFFAEITNKIDIQREKNIESIHKRSQHFLTKVEN